MFGALTIAEEEVKKEIVEKNFKVLFVVGEKQSIIKNRSNALFISKKV